MTDFVTFEYDRAKLDDLARRRGFKTIQEYLHDLIEWDMVYLAEEENVAADQAANDDSYDLEAGLREAFRDSREGRTYPIESLREMLEADDDEDTISAAEHFREGWREALSGNEGMPYDEMWEESKPIT